MTKEELWRQTEQRMQDKHGTFVPHSIVLDAFCEELLGMQREVCACAAHETILYEVVETIPYARKQDFSAKVQKAILNAKIPPNPPQP